MNISFDPAHEIEIDDILIGENNRKMLFDLVNKINEKKSAPIFFVMDDTVIKAGPADIKEEIYLDFKKKSRDVEKIILRHKDNPGGIVHADFKNVEKVKGRLSKDAIVVSIGSGTITDIAKHATYLFAKENSCAPIPFIVVQTANTVTAFTSNIAVLYKDGVKRTYPSRYPDYVISDLAILRDAPLELSQAGFGDLIARYVSYADWYLGYKLKNLDTYSEVPKTLLDEPLEYLLKHAEGIKNRDTYTIEILTKALLNAGISMSIVGMSTPISGYEHVISHVLDMIAALNNRKPALHGLQVGLATVFSAYVYEELLNNIDLTKVDFEKMFPGKNEALKILKERFSKKGFSEKNIQELLIDYTIKLDKWNNARDDIKNFLVSIKNHFDKLSELTKSGNVLKMAMQSAGISIKPENFDPPIPEEDLEFAFLNAHFIRQRFTIADLLSFAGILNGQLYKRIYKRVYSE